MSDALIEANLTLVARLARSAYRRLHRSDVHRQITLEELRSAGYLGLIDAARRFDATKGARFTTFATRRIYGAMLDDVRSNMPCARSHWRHVRDSKAPVFEETISDHLTNHLPTTAPTPEALALHRAAVRVLHAAIAAMPSRRLRRIIMLRFRTGERNADVARVLRLSESRVSQLEHLALQQLRTRLCA